MVDNIWYGRERLKEIIEKVAREKRQETTDQEHRRRQHRFNSNRE